MCVCGIQGSGTSRSGLTSYLSIQGLCCLFIIIIIIVLVEVRTKCNYELECQQRQGAKAPNQLATPSIRIQSLLQFLLLFLFFYFVEILNNGVWCGFKSINWSFAYEIETSALEFSK